MTSIIKEHGVHKVIFGTDSPWGEQAKEVEMLKALELSPEELQLIFSDNVKNILDLF